MKKLLVLLLITSALTAFSQPVVTVTSPNGGENLVAGSTYTITWTNQSIGGPFEIFHSSDGGFGWGYVANAVFGNSYNWTVANINGSNNKIKVVSMVDLVTMDNSDGVFTITGAGAIPLTAHAGNDVTFCNNSNDTIRIGNYALGSATGGTPPYNYSWNPANGLHDNVSPTPLIISTLGSGSTTYVVTVTDALANTATDTVVVFWDNVGIAQVLTSGTCNSDITIQVSNGMAPFTYSIDNGTTFQASGNFSALPPGTYTIVVQDVNGCTTDTSVMLQGGGMYIDSIVTTNPTCHGVNDGTACVYVSGGTGGFIFSWSPIGGNTACKNNLMATTFTVTITDANNCSTTTSFTLTDTTLVNVSLISSTSSGISVLIEGGVQPYYVTWGDGNISFLIDDTAYYTYSSGGTYGLRAVDSNGCYSAYLTTPQLCHHCVWPGDADYNGLADNNDLLAIGLGYGTTGSARPNQTIGWFAHSANNWADTLATGANYKHIDCNGDGIINADDTLAILQNFGLTHSKNNEPEPWRGSIPALYVDLIPDTTYAGDTLYANLTLGDANIPANNVYAIAFTLNYDANVVDSAKTQAVFGNSWLGNASDKISIAKDLKLTGQLKCAITRIDHTTRSGNGQIGQVSFVITTDNINGKTYAYHNMHVWLSDVRMIDSLGNILDVNEGQDSSQVEFEPTGVREVQDSKFKIQINPNPATDLVVVAVTENLIGAELRVTDINGRFLLSGTIPAVNSTLNTTSLANGIYLVQIICDKGILTKRLAIAR